MCREHLYYMYDMHHTLCLLFLIKDLSVLKHENKKKKKKYIHFRFNTKCVTNYGYFIWKNCFQISVDVWFVWNLLSLSAVIFVYILFSGKFLSQHWFYLSICYIWNSHICIDCWRRSLSSWSSKYFISVLFFYKMYSYFYVK